jgi:hypothetical protein
VVAFIAPNLPLTTLDLTCTDILVEFRQDGQWTLNAHVEGAAHVPIIFVAGFVTNEHGYFGGLIGVLNFEGGPTNVTSSNSIATVSINGFSHWIQENYTTARAEGVTFRIHSSRNMQGRLRALVQEWAATFGKPLFRPLSILDTDHRDDVAWGVPFMEGGSLTEDTGEDDGLSFRVSLRFE